MKVHLLSNFFSVGALIAASFALLVSLFLIFLKDRSKSTLYLGLALFVMALFNIAYVESSLVYHQVAAFHRWFTVAGALFASVFAIQFFFLFPDSSQESLRKRVLYIQSGLNFLVVVFFAIQTLSADYIFRFDGHYWDFKLDKISRIVGLYIMLNVAAIAAFGIYRFVKTKSWTLLIILISFLVVTVVPAWANVASRDGKIGRDIFMILTDLCNISGYFIAIVAYINKTQDRTTFMVKIIGISLVTFLLMLEFISYTSLTDKEGSYDKMKTQEASLFLLNKEKGDELLYHISYSGFNRQFTENYFGQKHKLDIAANAPSFANSLVYAKLSALDKPESFLTSAGAILERAPTSFAAYKAQLNGYLKQKGITKGELLKRIAKERRKILFAQNKLDKISAKSFKDAGKKYVEGMPASLNDFKKAVLMQISSASIKEPSLLKKQTLHLFTPFVAPGTRLYRQDRHTIEHYVSFHRVDLRANRVNEIGYSYLAYRNFIHPMAVTFSIYLAVLLVVVLIGYRFFLSGALLNPLETLLTGVAKVNEGDLDVEVEIKVEDEIGFLSRSFNDMVASIRDAKSKLEAYANELEDKVKERTKELQKTLEEVQALKVKQDGDYFLTSLLIKPLMMNNVKSETVQVDFFIKQYKKFRFRRWDADIGGDLNAAESLMLHGRPYTVFLNADAMGKSMQGAGGALVLGSVFSALIQRTKVSESANQIFPERWLKNSFLELHKAFESFDGTMLVSLVLALIDDQTGHMYYINAEHPFTMLYRDGKASFIEEELFFRKLGTTGMEGSLHIRTFQLEPGDVILLGSDGRDDLALESDDAGNRVMNEDMDQVLLHVEQAKGDLEKIFDLSKEFGEISDDFSLVRASYRESELLTAATGGADAKLKVNDLLRDAREQRAKGNFSVVVALLEEAVSIDSSNREAYRELVRAYLKLKEYKKSAAYAEDYMYLRPGEAEMIYIASYCNKLLGKYNYAADLGERVRLRDPDKVKNLLNLADIYAILGNFERAEGLLEEVFEKDGGNEKAEKLRKFIAEKKVSS